MICSVGVYAILGALVMRKLETRTMTETRSEVEVRHSQDSNGDAVTRKTLVVRMGQNRQRRHNDAVDVAVAIKRMNNRRERRATAEVVRNEKCVINVIRMADCEMEKLDENLMKELDKCYYVNIGREMQPSDLVSRNSDERVENVAEEHDEIEAWSFVESLLFTFTVITTIGYGNVAPRTFEGRVFVICYGFIGIPFTLLAIADLGKFLSELMAKCTKILERMKKRIQEKWRMRTKLKKSRYEASGNAFSKCRTMLEKSQSQEDIVALEDEKEKHDEISESEDDGENSQATLLFIFFIIYIVLGGLMLATYEPDMDFFKAIYFNFVTLTSIGLGDIVPRSETYLLLTIIYITVGLALTTIAIEIAADTLKKLHYFGRKIENVGNVAIWFGGKKITMKALVKNLGDQFNLPTGVMKDLDLDHFVDQAIKVEEGEIETLRPPPFVPDSAGFQKFAFVDESKEEIWNCNSKPPSLSALPSLPSSPTRSEQKLSLGQLSPSPSEQSTVPTLPRSRSSSLEGVREWSPIPTSVPSPRETATPRFPIPAPRELTPLPREPTPIAEPEREPSMEIEPQHNPEPQSVIEIELEPRPEHLQEQASSVKVRLLTMEDIVPRTGRVYSEEARRRYMEYQKQWKKFRQTQRMGPFIFEESGRDLDGTSITKNSQT